MAKLLKHLGLGGSTKKITSPTEGGVSETATSDKHRTENYGTLVDCRTTGVCVDSRTTGGFLNTNNVDDHSPLEYEARTLPIHGNLRRQLQGSSTAPTGGIRDWSLRGYRSVKHPSYTPCLKEKACTSASKGKTVIQGDELDSEVTLQRSVTSEFIEASRIPTIDNGIESVPYYCKFLVIRLIKTNSNKGVPRKLRW